MSLADSCETQRTPPTGLASFVLFVSLLALSVFSLYCSRTWLQSEQSRARITLDVPPLYLPEEPYVRLVTMGFDNFFADLLWFNTLSYFGRQFAANRDYRWFGNMCRLVTTLDSRAHHAFEFCATLLAWVAREPEASIDLLSRAVSFHPDRWRYRYLRGFNYWYFLNRRDLAQRDLAEAARIEGSPPALAAIASRLMVAENDPKTAVAFLEEVIRSTKDETAKRALSEKLKRAYLSFHLSLLQKAQEEFERRFERPLTDVAELVSSGLMTRIPREPFGGEYMIDKMSGLVVNSSGEAGLDFAGKTAETGVAKHEFSKDRNE